ncbi:MAG: DNA polymerase III subunit gamma/tau [Sphingomonadaceae bacterium]|nr:DNA polymerase III subunit gamma/tau [Sphingomonadaceae bacterium]
MDDSPDIFGDEQNEDGENQPSAAELEAAGQSALFGGDDEAAKPEVKAEPEPEPDPEPNTQSQAEKREPRQPEPNPPVIKAEAAKPAQTTQPYRVLARKYRPQTFSELIGQEAMVQTLANAITRDRLAHAFLMTGVRGVGKTSTARLIAKALNCIGPDEQGGPTIDPCGVCEPCVAIAEGRHIDVIEMDAASHTGVDDVREIIEAVRYAAVSARYKIYIIDEVHMLSRNAFNALLKTLEEPPAHVKFLFATTEVGKLPVTVLSRCQRFDLKRIQAPLLAEHFANICAQEGVEAEAEALAMIAAAAEGSVRDGLSILDQAIAHADLDSDARIEAAHVRDMLGLADKSAQRSLLNALLSGHGEALLGLIDQQFSLGVEPQALLRGLMELIHRITVVQVGGKAADAGSAEEREALEGWSASLKPGQLHRLWQLLIKGHDEVRSAPDPLVAAQMALLRVMHACDMPDPGELAKKLGEIHLQPSGPAEPTETPAAPGAEASPPWSALVERVGQSSHLQAWQVMRDWVRVISLEADTLKFSLVPGFSGDPSSDIRKALEDVTQQDWHVKRLDEGGQPSMRETDERNREAAEQIKRSDPLVEATFAAFPDAEFVQDDNGARRVSGAKTWRN